MQGRRYSLAFGETQRDSTGFGRVATIAEIEKSLAGVSNNSASGDSGTSKRSGGYFLQYFNEPKAGGDGYHLILGTSNDIQALPPEYTRAGRWDALFWFGLPQERALKAVLKLYSKKYGHPTTFGKRADLKDMTPAEVESVCRTAALLETNEWEEALPYVPRLVKFRHEEIETMTAWASGRAVSADDDPEADLVKKIGGRNVRK